MNIKIIFTDNVIKENSESVDEIHFNSLIKMIHFFQTSGSSLDVIDVELKIEEHDEV